MSINIKQPLGTPTTVSIKIGDKEYPLFVIAKEIHEDDGVINYHLECDHEDVLNIQIAVPASNDPINVEEPN